MKKRILAVTIMFFSVLFLVACGSKSFKVTFDANGGAPVPAVQEIQKDKTAVKPANPTKEGFEFVEWQLGGAKYDFKTKVSGDITLVAKWKEIIKHLVKFDYDDNDKIVEESIQQGKKVAEPEQPTKEGYIFIEWQLDGEGYDFNETVTKPITLIAKWEKLEEGTVTFSITFDSDGGSAVSGRTVIEGNVVVKPADPTKEGYDFVEWQLNGKAYDFSTPVTTNITLKAVWDKKEDVPPIGRPTEIVIMHGAVHEIDPRHKDYTGTEQANRIALHEQIEEEMNVKIVYKQYPPNAPWGPGRQEAIINWHLAGNAEADIYWIPTIWLTEIAKSNAIVPINKWLNKHGKKINDDVIEMTNLHGQVYGFSPEPFTGEKGLFYNVELLEDLGIDDPVDMWNAGNWNWDTFEALAIQAKAALSSEQAVLGGNPAIYAESLIPLNGGSIVTTVSGIGFNRNPAFEVYEYLNGLYNKGLFEPNPGYDAGSDLWAAGNVLFHPGNLWFVRADNRFGEYEFVQKGKIGVVPYPLPVGKSKSSYKQPIGGEAIYTVAANPNDRDKEELAFEVWNKIQLWDTFQPYGVNFEDSLIKTFDEQKFVDVYMEIYDKVYYDVYTDLGISQYGTNSWYSRVNLGIKDNTARTKMDEIIDAYQKALDEYLGNE